MNIILGIIVIAALVVAVLLSRRKTASTSTRRSQVDRRNRPRHSQEDRRRTPRHPRVAAASSQYHAVSLHLSRSACDAAKSLGDKRFLADAAPRIPLMDCDAQTCRCRFKHHKDRRSGDDRRSPIAGSISAGTGQFQKERRYHSERRKELPYAY
jgi:hypothetical protein